VKLTIATRPLPPPKVFFLNSSVRTICSSLPISALPTKDIGAAGGRTFDGDNRRRERERRRAQPSFLLEMDVLRSLVFNALYLAELIPLPHTPSRYVQIFLKHSLTPSFNLDRPPLPFLPSFSRHFAMALRPSLSFLRLGSITSPHILEVYLDTNCPFSAKIVKSLDENVLPRESPSSLSSPRFPLYDPDISVARPPETVISAGGKLAGKLSFIVRLQPQPW